MILTVPDAMLGEMLATQALLLHAWPDGARDVMRLVNMLRVMFPSLAGVFALGITVMADSSTRANVVLTYRRVQLTATGCDADGVPLADAHSRLHEVTRLDILTLAVDGQPALQVTA